MTHPAMLRSVSAALAAMLVLAPTAACAQRGAAGGNARSQLGGVTQSIGGTRVEIVYRRPVARGRTLFGALVPWGHVWTPSADSAARITVSGPVEVNGSPLAAGSYALWAIPDSTAWTMIFSTVPEVFHLRYPEGKDALRVRATPTQGEHVETLAFVFPVVDADSAVLQLRWGTTVVPLTLRARRAPSPPGGRETRVLALVRETVREGDAGPVYRRFRDQGRLAPEGLRYVSSWVTEDFRRCYQVMECDDRALLDAWMARWRDLVEFEVLPVRSSADAAAAIAPRL